MANTQGKADHKAASPTTPGLTVERTKSIILLLVQLFSVTQTGLSIAGISQLPFTTDQVSTAITGVVAVVASIWAWWRNNNVTAAAVQGQAVTDAIKLAIRTGDAADQPAATPLDAAPSSDTQAATARQPVARTAIKTDANGDPVLDDITGTPIIETEPGDDRHQG